MRVCLCQVDSHWEDRVQTRERIAEMVESWNGCADCLVFPEMGLSGFSMNLEATTLDRTDHSFFSELALKKEALILYGGVEEGYNCIFSVEPGRKPRTEYRKRHLFSFGGEDGYYKFGNNPAIVNFGGMRFGLAVCYDLRFAYHFWSNAADCDGYIVIASWPESRREHWSTLLRARAIENQAYVIGVNRVGNDPRLSYSGDSAVYGPFGERLIECGSREGVYSCDFDAVRVAEIRSTYRFLEDRKS